MLLFDTSLLTQMAIIDIDQSLFVNWAIFLVTATVLYHIILKPVLAIQRNDTSSPQGREKRRARWNFALWSRWSVTKA